MGDMISDNCLAIKKKGYDYFLDSIKVCVSSVTHDPNDRISSIKCFSRKKNHTIEHSTGHETTLGIARKFRITNGVELGGGSKDIHGTKFTSDE